MKIGIITLPLRNNYGGLLQAFAMQTVLKKLGHDSETLDKPLSPPINWIKYPLMLAKRLYLMVATKEKVRLFDEFYYRREIKIISQHTQLFVKRHIKRREINDFGNINTDDYDVLLVGSDQVWRPQYQSPIVSFLGFAKKRREKRIAYAASFGTDVWQFSNIETEKCRKWILDFDAISVREESGITLCRDYLKVDAKHVLDPTMLLTKEEYISICELDKIEASKGDLMSYVLEENHELSKLIAYIEETDNLHSFSTNSKFENSFAPEEQRIQAPVEQWLRGVYDAKMVITDSFHACVFSIIFNRPFVVIGNKDRGLSRFESLLTMFGQEYRLVTTLDEYRRCEEVIHNEPNVNLDLWRKKSLDYLKENL